MTEYANPYGGLLDLLEALAEGETIADILACAECEQSKDNHDDDTLSLDTEPHTYEPNNEDAAKAIEDYDLASAEDLTEILNTVVLEIVVIRKGSLSDVGDIESINLVMGTGGPHDQLNVDDDGYIEHEHVEWFRGEGTRTDYVGRYVSFGGYLYDLAGEMTEGAYA